MMSVCLLSLVLLLLGPDTPRVRAMRFWSSRSTSEAVTTQESGPKNVGNQRTPSASVSASEAEVSARAFSSEAESAGSGPQKEKIDLPSFDHSSSAHVHLLLRQFRLLPRDVQFSILSFLQNQVDISPEYMNTNFHLFTTKRSIPIDDEFFHGFFGSADRTFLHEYMRRHGENLQDYMKGGTVRGASSCAESAQLAQKHIVGTYLREYGTVELRNPEKAWNAAVSLFHTYPYYSRVFVACFDVVDVGEHSLASTSAGSQSLDEENAPLIFEDENVSWKLNWKRPLDTFIVSDTGQIVLVSIDDGFIDADAVSPDENLINKSGRTKKLLAKYCRAYAILICARSRTSLDF